MSFKLGSINNRAVLLSEDKYYDLETVSENKLSYKTSEALLNIDLLNHLHGSLNNLKASGSLEGVVFDAPVSDPKNCYAVGLNYRNHAEEAGMQIPEVPMIFTKHTTCLVSATADIEMRSNYVDYEAELVVVIGKKGKDISKQDAWDYVAGVCIGQDISDRPAQFAATPAQFNLGKSFDTFGPIGPYLVSPDMVNAKDGLSIECRVNDEVRQSDNTNDLIFDVPNIIAYLSEILTLNVGDVIFTGTPGGVGVMEGKFLKDGDILSTTIEGLGTMTNKCVRVKDHSKADFIPEMFKPLFDKKD
ncbi:MAG: fumarylacetoacetate hydrolase family protein [SAR86 cluster bacterium]|nr:fumarylacetoacetate hydrolase family protein [SAR86 cluster bacterium]|tara:strand:+ start:218 stop:1123 length:906 start_codon:yes stop_codon:yes gene_type:complete